MGGMFFVVLVEDDIKLPIVVRLWVFLAVGGLPKNLCPFQGDFRCCVRLSGHLAIGEVAPLTGSAHTTAPESKRKVSN